LYDPRRKIAIKSKARNECDHFIPSIVHLPLCMCICCAIWSLFYCASINNLIMKRLVSLHEDSVWCKRKKILIDAHLSWIGRVVLGWIHIWISTKALDMESVEIASCIDLSHISQNWEPQNWWKCFRLLLCLINHWLLNASQTCSSLETIYKF
jgi:hypothetical protein